MPTLSNSNLLDQPRYRFLVSRLYSAGERSLGEFLAALARRYPEIQLMAELEPFATVDVENLRRAGGDRWPVQIHPVPDAIMRPSISTGAANRVTILRRSLAPRRDPDGDAA